MLDVGVSRGGHRGVQVQLLRDRAFGQIASGKLRDLLECQRRTAE